jgi:hypothetical protein
VRTAPQSNVAREFGLSINRSFLIGVEAELQNVKGIEADRLHCFVDSELAPGYIGWAIPGVGGITPDRPRMPATASTGPARVHPQAGKLCSTSLQRGSRPGAAA